MSWVFFTTLYFFVLVVSSLRWKILSKRDSREVRLAREQPVVSLILHQLLVFFSWKYQEDRKVSLSKWPEDILCVPQVVAYWIEAASSSFSLEHRRQRKRIQCIFKASSFAFNFKKVSLYGIFLMNLLQHVSSCNCQTSARANQIERWSNKTKSICMIYRLKAYKCISNKLE